MMNTALELLPRHRMSTQDRSATTRKRIHSPAMLQWTNGALISFDHGEVPQDLN